MPDILVNVPAAGASVSEARAGGSRVTLYTDAGATTPATLPYALSATSRRTLYVGAVGPYDVTVTDSTGRVLEVASGTAMAITPLVFVPAGDLAVADASGTYAAKAGAVYTGAHDFTGATVTGITGGGGGGAVSSVVGQTGDVTGTQILADTAVAAALAGKLATTAGAVGTSNLADGAVTSGKIADGTIATGDISDGAVTAAKVAADVATQAELDAVAAAKANIASPAFTGNPTAPTPAAGDYDTSVATTAFVGDALPWVDVKRVYGLAGDGKQLADVTTTGGSATITSASANFTAGDVGKVVRVESTTPVVTTISSVTNSTTAVLAATIATSHTNMIVYYGTDDTAKVQQALDAASVTAIQAGGKVTLYFRAGIYMIGGALQDAATWNSQLKVPYTDMSNDSGTMPWTLRLLGDGRNEGYYLTGAPLPPTGGTILYSTLQGSGTEPSVIRFGPRGSAYPNANYCHAEVDGITWRTGNKTNMTALDLSEVNSCRVGWERGVTCDVGVPTNILGPTSSSNVGLEMPTFNSGACNQVGSVYVNGYRYGVKASEHFDAKSLVIQSCWAAMFFGQMNHAAHIDRLLVQWCIYGFGSSHACYLSIDQLDIEHAVTGFFSYANDFDDAADRFHAVVSAFHVVRAGVGPANSEFTVNGARNLWAMPGTGGKLPVKTANYTMTNGDVVVIANGTSITITLPDPALAIKGGREYVVKNVNSTSCTVNSAGTSKTIDGASTQSLVQWATGRYVSDGTNWFSV